MVKVLFLINNLGNGGAERVLVNLANGLSKNPAYEITIRCLDKSGPQLDRLANTVKCEGIIRTCFIPRGLSFLYLLPKKWIYKKIIGNGNYDIIIPFLHGVLTRIVSYAPESQKTVAYLHANMQQSSFIRQLGSQEKIQKIFNTYNRIIAVSEDVKKSFIKASGISDDRIEVIYNTFAVEEIRKLAGEPLDVEMDHQILNICSVGKLEKIKGYDRLINVAGKLRDNGFLFHLYIIGEGSERSSLQKKIKELRLEKYITLLGRRENPYKYISNSDLFVCSSYSEGLSSVVVESIIIGVPVLTTDCSGMKEILGQSSEYGLIVSNDEKGLYDGLLKMTDKRWLSYYRDKAAERSSCFDSARTIKSVEQMICEVVKQ